MYTIFLYTQVLGNQEKKYRDKVVAWFCLTECYYYSFNLFCHLFLGCIKATGLL